jgi:putative redox protein
MKGNVRTAHARWIEGKEFDITTGSGHHVVVDSNEKGGGKNHGPSPMELVLVGLAGCGAMDVIDILKKKRETVTGLDVRVDGERADTTPAVYNSIEICYVVRGKGVSPQAVESAIHLSETKYCSVGAMLGKTAKIKTWYKIVKE